MARKNPEREDTMLQDMETSTRKKMGRPKGSGSSTRKARGKDKQRRIQWDREEQLDLTKDVAAQWLVEPSKKFKEALYSAQNRVLSEDRHRKLFGVGGVPNTALTDLEELAQMQLRFLKLERENQRLVEENLDLATRPPVVAPQETPQAIDFPLHELLAAAFTQFGVAIASTLQGAIAPSVAQGVNEGVTQALQNMMRMQGAIPAPVQPELLIKPPAPLGAPQRGAPPVVEEFTKDPAPETFPEHKKRLPRIIVVGVPPRDISAMTGDFPGKAEITFYRNDDNAHRVKAGLGNADLVIVYQRAVQRAVEDAVVHSKVTGGYRLVRTDGGISSVRRHIAEYLRLEEPEDSVGNH